MLPATTSSAAVVQSGSTHSRNPAQRQLGLVVLLASLAFVCETAMAVEEPPYTVNRADGRFELRTYPGFVVAETWVDGDFDAAGRTGFRRIAGYIFGKNRSRGGDAEKIAMTAPVTMEPATQDQATSERIAMTAPVTMESDGLRWRIHFVMPAGYTLQSLPQPLDPEIMLRAVPSHRMAAVRFSGWTTRTSIAEQTALLTDWLHQQGLRAAGTPQVARYNDPFTLPWNRRNEILLPVE